MTKRELLAYAALYETMALAVPNKPMVAADRGDGQVEVITYGEFALLLYFSALAPEAT